MQLVEFNVTVDASKRDTSLPEKLEAEFGGILAWGLQGCLDWQAQGLAPPAEVLAATDEYLDAEDSIEQWMAECCYRSGTAKLSDAHRSFREWCDKNASPSLGRNAFADQLVSHGAIRIERDNGKLEHFDGISIIRAPISDSRDDYEDRMSRDRNMSYNEKL